MHVPLALTVYTCHLDTVYGCQDKEDDIKIGVWSTALFFGDHVWFACVILAIGFVFCLYLAGVSNGHSAPYFTISVAGSFLQLSFQLSTLDTNSMTSCWSE